jgi:hypothetical protein
VWGREGRQNNEKREGEIPGNIARLELSLPMTFDYLTQDFSRNIERDLSKAEK